MIRKYLGLVHFPNDPRFSTVSAQGIFGLLIYHSMAWDSPPLKKSVLGLHDFHKEVSYIPILPGDIIIPFLTKQNSYQTLHNLRGSTLSRIQG